MRDSLNLPNLFTFLRIVLAPFVIQSILAGQHIRALLLLVAAALTDVFDGALARGLGSTTNTGAYLDPVADKILLSGVYLAMAAARIVPWWFVALIFGRDLFILAGAGVSFLFLGRRKFPPSVWGKLCTFFQAGTAVVWMARNAAPSPTLNQLAGALLWPTAAATVWSGLHYAWRALREARTH